MNNNNNNILSYKFVLVIATTTMMLSAVMLAASLLLPSSLSLVPTRAYAEENDISEEVRDNVEEVMPVITDCNL